MHLGHAKREKFSFCGGNHSPQVKKCIVRERCTESARRMPVKEASDSGVPRMRHNNAENSEGERDAAPVEAPAAQDNSEVFGDTQTNLIMLAMCVLAWIAQQSVQSNCTC